MFHFLAQMLLVFAEERIQTCSMLMVRQCCGVQCRATCTRSLMHACCRISTFHKESWIKTQDTVNFFVDFNYGLSCDTDWQRSGRIAS